jgi:hypothetical protein
MDSSNKERPEPPDDIERLRREIEELRQRLEQTAEKGKRLLWDTALLVKQTEKLKQANKISCATPNWRQIVEEMEIGPEGIWIADVQTVEDIQFVAEFAADRRLAMTYGNRSFHLHDDTQPGADR